MTYQVFLCGDYRFDEHNKLLTIYPPIDAVVVCSSKKFAERFMIKNLISYNAMVCPELVFNTKGQQPTHYIIDGQKEIIKITR
jgi:hypothetical protein